MATMVNSGGRPNGACQDEEQEQKREQEQDPGSLTREQQQIPILTLFALLPWQCARKRKTTVRFEDDKLKAGHPLGWNSHCYVKYLLGY